MDIYFGNLPNAMSTFELRRIVNRALSDNGIIEAIHSIFKPQEKVKRLEFDIISELKAGKVFQYGKATIEPDIVAKRVIGRINNSMTKSKRIVAREFLSRSYSNDRRSIGWRSEAWLEAERRNNERRIASSSIENGE